MKHQNKMPRHGGGRGQRPKMDLKKSSKIMKRIMSIVLKNYAPHCILVVLFIFGSSIANVKGTLFMQTLIDDYIVPMTKQTSPDFGPLSKAIFNIALVYIAGAFMSFAYNRIMVYVSQGAIKKIRIELFTHMESLPIKYFDTHSHGNIMSIYTNDTDTLRQLIGQSMPEFISSIVTVISVFISMIILNIPLTILTVIMVLCMIYVSGKVGGKSGRYFKEQQKHLGELNGFIEEMMEGQKVVKVFCHEEESIKRFNELNEELFESAKNANSFANILMPININLGHMGYVLCAIVGSLLAITNVSRLTLGALASFLQLNKSFSRPVNQLSQQLNSIVMALAGADRIFKLMDEDSEVDNGYVTLVNAKEEDGNIEECEEHTGTWAWKYPHKDGSISLTKLQGNVVFNDVDFGYNEDKIILHNIKLYAEPGQKIAFVGPTGAGKTTITNLINRFYDIQDGNGKIKYDGININKIKKSDLRRSLGIVLQDTHLFTGTVADNIRYGKLDASEEEVVKAAKLANAHGFITRLPQGYDTLLTGNGATLSQGQRQLLSIARAAVADPPVLILDEATSSIDTRTEHLVQDGMDRLMNDRTTFVIAHRLSTVRNSDAIMVLELGKIIERGDHESLIAKSGRYYQLYTGAFELE